MGISFWQIAIVVVLVVLLFGRGKISALMGDLAKGIKSFKKGMKDPAQDQADPQHAWQEAERLQNLGDPRPNRGSQRTDAEPAGRGHRPRPIRLTIKQKVRGRLPRFPCP